MFGFTKPTFLGIDFGTSSIKAVELSVKDGQVVLENYGEISLTEIEKTRIESQGSYDAQVTTYLRALLERLGPKTQSAYVAMPSFIGLVALVEFPLMSEKELEEAIKFEAHKYIPSPLEEVALSWEIVGERLDPEMEEGETTGRVEVLLVAALNKEVERYESYVNSVQYGMQLLELETFSLVRSVVNSDPGVKLVVDIGSRATNLVLVENGLVKVSRNLDVGGRDVTRTLTEGLNIALERAEALKKSGKDYLNAPESKIIFPSLEAIGGEAGRMIEAFQKKHPEKTIDGIILSGGTALLTGIVEYYSKMLSVPVEIGNPWRQVVYPPELETSVDRMRTSFSVALGLALQGAYQYTHKTPTRTRLSNPAASVFKKIMKRLKQPIGE
jgi:type IV pilus assembly protein PilM